MPFWGLIITSTGFVIPFLVAKRKKKRRHMLMSAALTCTSVWFHATTTPLAMFVDKICAHSLGTIFWCESIHNLWRNRRRIDVVFVATINGVIYIYFCKSRVNDGLIGHLWHMTMHFVAITGWTVYLIK